MPANYCRQALEETANPNARTRRARDLPMLTAACVDATARSNSWESGGPKCMSTRRKPNGARPLNYREKTKLQWNTQFQSAVGGIACRTHGETMSNVQMLVRHSKPTSNKNGSALVNRPAVHTPSCSGTRRSKLQWARSHAWFVPQQKSEPL